MAVISGKSGTLSYGGSEEAEVLNWSLTTTSANDAYHSNDSGGWKKRVAGVKDSSGSFEMRDLPTMSEGDSAEAILYTNQDIYTVTIIIDSINVNVDINDGTAVNWTVNFSGNGAVVKTTGSAP
jgi:hypothetical protein